MFYLPFMDKMHVHHGLFQCKLKLTAYYITNYSLNYNNLVNNFGHVSNERARRQKVASS